MKARIETLYRVMYESFTPEMMRRLPMWLKQRMARVLGYRLVDELSTDAFMKSLFTANKGDLVPMAVKMFENSVGGTSTRPFFSLRFHWQIAQRVSRGETHTAKQLKELGELRTSSVEFPGFPSTKEMPFRRRSL